jgi:hypothetical protein
MKPMANNIGVSKDKIPYHIVPIQLKILIAVGIAITKVAAVKYDRVSTSNPIVYI